MNLTTVNLKQGYNIAQAIQQNSDEMRACFYSTILKVPPYQKDQLYKSVAIFTLPKSFFDKNIQFFVASRDEAIPSGHAMPNGVVGHTDIVDN